MISINRHFSYLFLAFHILLFILCVFHIMLLHPIRLLFPLYLLSVLAISTFPGGARYPKLMFSGWFAPTPVNRLGSAVRPMGGVGSSFQSVEVIPGEGQLEVLGTWGHFPCSYICKYLLVPTHRYSHLCDNTTLLTITVS